MFAKVNRINGAESGLKAGRKKEPWANHLVRLPSENVGLVIKKRTPWFAQPLLLFGGV